MSTEGLALIWLQAWSGAPIYLAATVFQGLWLHRHGFGPVAMAGAALLSIALSILAGVVIWGRWFPDQSILLWDMVNVPATVAVSVMFPVVGGLVLAGFGADD